MMDGPSLRKFDSPVDRIRQHRQSSKRPILVLEGISDERFCARIFGRDIVDCFVVGTRDVVLETVEQLYKIGVDRIVGIVDRDFDDVVSAFELRGVPVVPWDNADLEAMLAFTSAFNDMLMEIGSTDKIRKYGGVSHIQEHASTTVVPIAKIRSTNSRARLGFTIDGVDIATKVRLVAEIASKPPRPQLVTQALCDAIVSASEHAAGTRVHLIEALDTSDRYCLTTGNSYVRGKDMLAVVGVMLRRAIGSLRKAETGSDQLSRVLRLAANIELLKETPWWTRMAAELKL